MCIYHVLKANQQDVCFRDKICFKLNTLIWSPAFIFGYDLIKFPLQAVKKHEEYFHERCSQLEKEFRDLLTLDIRPHQSNGTDGHYKTQL